MYQRSITDCVKREKMEERIFDLNKHFTSLIYQHISRSLFQAHVLVFSTSLCVGIMRKEGYIDEDVWSFLLTGGCAGGSTTQQVGVALHLFRISVARFYYFKLVALVTL